MATRTVHAVCPHDCYDTCGLQVTAVDGRITRVVGDAGHPITQGFLCFKVNRYLDRLYHADRVLTPLRRVGLKGEGRFERMSWDEALSEIGDALQNIIQQFSGEAILPYSFSGNMGVLSESSMDRRFFHAIGASQLDRTICTAAADAALRWVYGARLGPDPETLPQTQLIIIWGTNPMSTNVHEIPLLDAAGARGAHIWCIDPLKTATAERYGRHVALKPNTDYPLALGLAHAVLAQKASDAQFVAQYVAGFDAFREIVRPWTRERTLAVTGLLPEQFNGLVAELITRRPLLFRTGYGVQRQFDGAKTIWAISALSLLLGSPRDVGGGHLVGNGDAFGINRSVLTRPELQSGHPRTVNMLQLGHALTELTDPPVKALIVYNSNPATTAPDQRRVLQGLVRDDLLVIVHEQMMTDTARYADFVFPAAMSWEVLDLHTSYWHRYVQLSQPATPPEGESVANTEFFRRLARAMGLHHPAFRASDDDLIREALAVEHPWLQGISLESLKQDPVQKVRIPSHARPYLDLPIPTADGKFHMDPLPVDMEAHESLPLASGEFHLLSPSRRESIKSSFANLASVVKTPHPELLMTVQDMASLALVAGDWADVFNDLGSTAMVIKESTIPGPGTVVSYAVRWNGAVGSNVNQLTAQRLSDYGGGSTFYSTRVRIRKRGAQP